MTEDPDFDRYHRAEVDGVRIFYRRMGAGEPVVLLHGFPQTSFAWRKVMPLLAERHTVVAPDLRGCGASDRPDGGYEKRTVAAEIRGLVRQLELGPVTLVGHDVGMMVAYALACSFPDEVRRLVLIEAALPGLGLETLFDASKYPRMYHLPLFEAPNGLAEALIGGRERLFVDHFMRQQAYDPDALDERALALYARALGSPGALRAGIAYFRAHKVDAGHNRENARTRLRMPVMTVGGKASFGADLAGQITPLVEELHSVMIDECGHYVAEEQPNRLAEAMLGFMTR